MDKLSLSTCFGERGRPSQQPWEPWRGSVAGLRPFLTGPQESEQAPGQGLETARVALCWGRPGDLWPGTFPSETHGLPAWEAGSTLVTGRREAQCDCLLTHAEPREPSGFLEILSFPEPELASDTRQQSSLNVQICDACPF